MNAKADQLVLRAVIVLLAILVLLLLFRGAAATLPDLSSITSLPSTSGTSNPPEPQPALGANPARSLQPVRWQTVEPEARSAVPIERQLVIVPDPVTLLVSRERWSQLVEIPAGCRSRVRFAIGRMRIERNGIDLGIWYRKPSLLGQRRGNELRIVKVEPWAMLDRTPRVLEFDPTTRYLRFLSLEKKAENVVVEFF